MAGRERVVFLVRDMNGGPPLSYDAGYRLYRKALKAASDAPDGAGLWR